MDKQKVATIVVTYNRLSLLQECIQSLKDQTFKDHTIIVVNNGSTDDTPKWLEGQKDIIVITQENLGGAGGFFTGIKYACENGYDYSWVMDDDVVAEKDALEKLMLHAGITRGFLCSRIIDTHGEMCNVPKISSVRNKETNSLLWGEYLGDGMIRVDIASFVSVLILNSIVYEIGLPFREYFIWGDDTEYTSRISRRYPCYMAVNSLVTHKREIRSTLSIYKETNKSRIRLYYYFYRNRVHLAHGGIWKVLNFVYGLVVVFLLLLKWRLSSSWVVAKGVLSSLFFFPKIKFPSKYA